MRGVTWVTSVRVNRGWRGLSPGSVIAGESRKSVWTAPKDRRAAAMQEGRSANRPRPPIPNASVDHAPPNQREGIPSRDGRPGDGMNFPTTWRNSLPVSYTYRIGRSRRWPIDGQITVGDREAIR